MRLDWDRKENKTMTSEDTNEDDKRVIFNIRGRRFETLVSTIKTIPETKLAKLSEDLSVSDRTNHEYFFDRDPDIFNAVLNLCVLGKLHVPRNVCGAVLREELQFWNVPYHRISECCWRAFFQYESDMAILNTLIHGEQVRHDDRPKSSRSYRLWLILDKPSSSMTARVWYMFFLFVIFLSTVIFFVWNIQELRTNDLYLSEFITHHYPHLQESGNDKVKRLLFTDPIPVLFALETFCLLVFTVELVLRLVTCPNKLDFVKSSMNIINFILVLVMWVVFALEFVKSILADYESARWVYFLCKAISMVRLFLLLKLTKHFSALNVLILALKSSFVELFLMAVTFCMGMFIFASMIFYAEINDDNFSDIFISLWWAVITMSTVGYGDYYPTTPAGYVVGVACAMTGLLLLAMPVAIIASNFSEYYCQNNVRLRFEKLKKKFQVIYTKTASNKIHPDDNWDKDMEKNIDNVNIEIKI